MAKAIDRLTAEEIAALREFASETGRGIRWKGRLRTAWDTGSYGCEPSTRAVLQHLRNRLGTAWLSQFKFKE